MIHSVILFKNSFSQGFSRAIIGQMNSTSHKSETFQDSCPRPKIPRRFHFIIIIIIIILLDVRFSNDFNFNSLGLLNASSITSAGDAVRFIAVISWLMWRTSFRVLSSTTIERILLEAVDILVSGFITQSRRSFQYDTNVTISHRFSGCSGQRDYASEFQPYNRDRAITRKKTKKSFKQLHQKKKQKKKKERKKMTRKNFTKNKNNKGGKKIYIAK